VKKSIEEQLALYQHVIDAAPDIIHVISPDMRILLQNRRSRELLPSVKVGGHCYTCLHGRASPCGHCSVKKVFEDGQRQEHESVITASGLGREIIVHSTAAPIYDEDGNMIGALEILRDITERKKMEQALRDTARRLDRSNQIRELLLRMVRHDLGTPAGAILNATEYLLEDKERLGELLEDIEDIHLCASQIFRLIRDADVLSNVLTASHVTFQEINLSDLLADVIKKLAPVLKQSDVRIEAEIPEQLVIKGLPILKTVFENILVNGIKYGGAGGRLVISAYKSGSWVCIEIKDFGPGIPDEYKEKIFQEFERLAEDVPGTGLGLAIARQTVALHNGRIKVRDNPEGGAVFEVCLPEDPADESRH